MHVIRLSHMPALKIYALASLALLPWIARAELGDELLYNQVQFIGTFQSYHQAPPQAIINFLNQAPYQAAFANQSLNVPGDYFFSHLTLTELLEAGFRGFEIDVLDDPLPGLYAYSAGLKLAGQDSLISADLLQPGIKVMSSPDFDYGSSCYLFTSCLEEIAAYSAANPNHFPIFVVIHHGFLSTAADLLGNAYPQALTQLQATNDMPTNFTTGTHANLADVEEEILMVFNRNQLYTPDDLRADNNASSDAALRDIVLPGGALNGTWPTIGQLRGKIMFMADPDYLDEAEALHPNSTDSLWFFADDQGDTDPNVVMLDGYVDVVLTDTTAPSKPYPIVSNADAAVTADAYGEQNLVLQGFFLRSATDTSSSEPTNNYTTGIDVTATIGGPQFLSTFYDTTPPANLIPGSTYAVNPATVPNFNGAEAICNPVTTNAGEPTEGSTIFPFDGSIPQLGTDTILQGSAIANCSIPDGFSPGVYLAQPVNAPAPAPASAAA